MKNLYQSIRLSLYASIISIIVLSFLLSACGLNLQKNATSPAAEVVTTDGEQDKSPAETETAPLAYAIVTFRALVPEDTPIDDPVYINILDEVTGLYLNAVSHEMELDEELSAVYKVSLPFPIGTVVKYRYERQGDELRVAEHTSSGEPVRYRLLQVNGPDSVDDVISRWTDTEFTGPSGRIMGQASDNSTGQPIPNLLITAGGAQSYTHSDGTFLIEGLPPGIHNLVGYAMDGAYQTFQQGAEIAAESTTPTPIRLEPANFVDVTFEISLPANTPPLVPVRLAGNLYQLGNTFGTLAGGINTLSMRMPDLKLLGDGRYGLTIKLPSGADIQYKYTLGDGYWNAERFRDGSLRLRQLIVPEAETIIQDAVETWQTDSAEFISFDITVPETTPAGEIVSIQFNPLFGWTEPIPMWNLGNNRWAYVLYSPLNLPGNLSYRYCRNGQCGVADDTLTPGTFGKGRQINLDQLPQQLKESVDAWVDLGQPTTPTSQILTTFAPRSEPFISGVEFEPKYHPSYQPLLPGTLQALTNDQSKWLTVAPTWSITRINPPVFEPVAGKDPLWNDVVDTVQQAHSFGQMVAIKPTLTFPTPIACDAEPCPGPVDAFWFSSQRDFSWWLVWFDHYRDFLLHHADLAAKTGADALILSGGGLNPAMPSGTLADGQFSGIPSDALQRWQGLLDEVRARYSGPIWWSLPFTDGQIIPDFLQQLDGIYLEWSVAPPADGNEVFTIEGLNLQVSGLLDSRVKALKDSYNKPLILAISAPSTPDLITQEITYSAFIDAVNQRDWINGLVASGYYQPALLQDDSSSVNGKPAMELLSLWFATLNP